MTTLPLLAIALLQGAGPAPAAASPVTPAAPRCAPDNAGLKLPAGFCALLVGEGFGPVRHLVVAPNGDVIAAQRQKGLMLFRDTTGDGAVDVQQVLYAAPTANGVLWTDGAIYLSVDSAVFRLPYQAGALELAGAPETIARGLPIGGHSAKGLAINGKGDLFVSFGSLSNACQKPGEDRRGAFPSPNPCTELEQRAGIWRFDPARRDQTPATARRWATGLRNPMAMSLEPTTGTLYMAVHGRDQLTQNWNWSAEDGRENPAEEFGPAPDGADYGWPYCYFDPRAKVKKQNPEYGGDGTKVGDCAGRTQPSIGFPAHWAPNAVMFYTGTAFGSEYRNGAFIAFHGSWNRAPAPQQGYRVAFVPFKGGKPATEWIDFVLPAGDPTSIRPTGLAQGPDGSLYVSDDSRGGKIWRVIRQ